MKHNGLAAVVISLGMASSGCAVAVGAGAAGAGVLGYKHIKDKNATEASESSLRFAPYKITRVYECKSEGSMCNEVYVDKRREADVKKPVWFEDGWMFSGKPMPDGKLDQICWLKGDSLNKSDCKVIDSMNRKNSIEWQSAFDEVKRSYEMQK